MRTIDAGAVAAFYLRRQHLNSPRQTPLSRESLTRFVSDAGGLQLDSINVVDRAHYLTLWSRFGAYSKAHLDSLVYEKRVLVEYWAHAACLVASSDLEGWGRAMADYKRLHKGWSTWLKANPRILRQVESEIAKRGPLTSGAFARPASQGKAGGWWDWKPAQHALDFLWMSGRIGIHSRRHFHKSYDLAKRVLPPFTPIERADFPRWHIKKTLRALGAAAEADLSKYMTFPRIAPSLRKETLKKMLKDGAVVEHRVEGLPGRWFALTEDLPDLEKAAPARGTTLLSPFDSLLWHRARAKNLFGFDYKIEVYTPAAKRKYGYYTLPILHEGRLIGRIDPKNHREQRRLEVRACHLEAKPDDRLWRGLTEALRSLAEFVGATTIDAPDGPLREALAG